MLGEIAHQRLQRGPQRTYAVTDAYLEADLISFPSLHEGFGNALVEAVYFAKPLVVNRYTVYEADIRPLGFRFVEISGAITDRTVTEVHQLIRDEQRRADDAAHNFAIGLRHLGFAMLRERLAAVLASV